MFRSRFSEDLAIGAGFVAAAPVEPKVSPTDATAATGFTPRLGFAPATPNSKAPEEDSPEPVDTSKLPE